MLQNKKQKKIQRKGFSAKKGFSLIEVLTSLLVLSIGMLSVLVLMTRNIQNSINIKNQVIALQLAQEGVELVRNLKDNNTVADFQTVVTGNNYRIDYISSFNDFKISNNASVPQKKLNINNTNFFAHTGSTATKFYRKIEIAQNANEVTVKSVVGWDPSDPFPATCSTSNQCVAATTVLPYLN